MKAIWCAVWLLVLPGGEFERGLQLYRDGHYREAAAVFAELIQRGEDTPELHYNLALARWRAGDLSGAEESVERYAARAGKPRPELHAGLLGALRHDEARLLEHAAHQAAAAAAGPAMAVPAPPQPGAAPEPPPDPLPLLEQALGKALLARDHCIRAAVAAPANQEVQRNAERVLKYIDELQRRIDAEKKKREQQQGDPSQDGDQKKDDQQQQGDKEQQKSDDKQDQQKQDQKQQGEEQKGQEQKGDEQKGDQPKPDEQKGPPDDKQPPKDPQGHERPEPKPDEQKSNDPAAQPPTELPEPKPGEGEAKPEPEPKPGDAEPPKTPAAEPPRGDAPGEQVGARELTPEQAARIAEQLQQLDEKLKQIRARARTNRPGVERDW